MTDSTESLPMPSRTISREDLMALHTPPKPMQPEEKEALERLLRIAASDTGQSRKVAGFLLAWWNAESCGGFDLTDLWGVDTKIAADMLALLGLIARVHSYPDTLGYKPQFDRMVRDWRPHLSHDALAE